MALTKYYGFEHTGRSDALEADAAPIGTVFIFYNRAERDAWVNFPGRRKGGSQPMRDTLKSRQAVALLRRKLPFVDFSVDANLSDPM